MLPYIYIYIYISPLCTLTAGNDGDGCLNLRTVERTVRSCLSLLSPHHTSDTHWFIYKLSQFCFKTVPTSNHTQCKHTFLFFCSIFFFSASLVLLSPSLLPLIPKSHLLSLWQSKKIKLGWETSLKEIYFRINMLSPIENE